MAEEELICGKNEDEEIWRRTDDYYSPSIHITKQGEIEPIIQAISKAKE